MDLTLRPVKIRVGDREHTIYIRLHASDSALLGQMFVDEAYNLETLPRNGELRTWLSSCARRGKRPLIVDAGANIGLSALAFSAQVPDAIVLAIEPEPDNFELLQLNTVGYPILPLPVALGAGDDRLLLANPNRGEWGYIASLRSPQGSDRAIEVPGITVDKIFESFSHDCQPFIVKIDIEGAETEVFESGGRWIESVPLIIVELHDWMLPGARSSHPVLKRLLDADRDFVLKGENLFCMLNSIVMPSSTNSETSG